MRFPEALVIAIAVLTLWATLSVPARNAKRVWLMEMKRAVLAVDHLKGNEDQHILWQLKDVYEKHPDNIPRYLKHQLIEFMDAVDEFYEQRLALDYREDIEPIVAPLTLRLAYLLTSWRKKIPLWFLRIRTKKKDWTYEGLPPGTPRVLTPRLTDALQKKAERVRKAWDREHGR